MKISIIFTQLLHTQKLRSLEHVCPSFEFLESRWASIAGPSSWSHVMCHRSWSGRARAARPANFLPQANSSLLRLQHHQVKKADSSTFLLNAARSIYWQGAIFDRQQRSRNVRNLLVSLATLLYVTVAPLCLPSIIKGIINHLEMRCIFRTYHAVQS